MADSRWRAGAKVVGYVELALISISLAVYAVTKNRGTNFKEEAAVNIRFFGNNKRVNFFNRDCPKSEDLVEGTTLPATQVVALIGLIAVVSGLQIWAAVKLLNASEIGTEPKQALKNARFWRLITTLIFISTLCAVYGMGSSSSTAEILVVTIIAIWRGVHLCVISRFIKELEKIVASQTQTAAIPSLRNASVKMADLVWRARAKGAASLDLALISISMAVYAVTKDAYALVGGRAVDIDIHGDNYMVLVFHQDCPDPEKIVGGMTPPAILVVALIGLIAVKNGLQIWAAVKLLMNVSEIGSELEPKQALINACVLVLISTWCAVYGMGSSTSIADILPLTIFVVWRFVHLCVIIRFIKELEKIDAFQTDAVPMNLFAKQ